MQKPLSIDDRRKIRKNISLISIFIFIAIAFFSAIYYFVLRETMNDGDNFSMIFSAFFGIFALFFMGVIGYMISIHLKDLKNGVKNCYEGAITDKRLDIKKTTSHSAGGVRRTGGTRTSTKRNYFITVNGEEHSIDQSMYGNVKVGDNVYFEVAPKSLTVLNYKILENIVSEAAKPVQSIGKERYPNSKVKEAPLTARDKDLIRFAYQQKKKKRLKSIAFLAIPIAFLVYVKLSGLLLFLFPLPLLLIYHLIRFILLYRNYRKSLTNRRKKLIETYITDKLYTTLSHNGRHQQKYTLQTTYEPITVSQEVYEKLNSGDEITIHKDIESSLVFGVSKDLDYHTL